MASVASLTNTRELKSLHVYIITIPVTCGMELLIHSQTSTIAPLKLRETFISDIASYIWCLHCGFQIFHILPMCGIGTLLVKTMRLDVIFVW